MVKDDLREVLEENKVMLNKFGSSITDVFQKTESHIQNMPASPNDEVAMVITNTINMRSDVSMLMGQIQNLQAMVDHMLQMCEGMDTL